MLIIIASICTAFKHREPCLILKNPVDNSPVHLVSFVGTFVGIESKQTELKTKQ